MRARHSEPITHQTGGPIVETTGGAVQGSVENGICVFRGIPYAEPPVGKLRFRPPVPRRWDGVCDATRFGRVAPQLFDTEGEPLGTQSFLGAANVGRGDDCLSLNVWTPEPGPAALPVLVWIHGGSLRTGAGSDVLYNGATFARDGVVTVTINYRLDALGFLYVGDRPGSGNFGLLDQIAALTWVRDNIAAFGGDPGLVTVAGESAGGHSVGVLLGTPSAAGLFRRAILQSGATSYHQSVQAAAVLARAALEPLGVEHDDLDALATLTDTDLMKAHHSTDRRRIALLTRHDIVPSVYEAIGPATLMTSGTDVLPEPPLAAVARGAARGVDLLVGTNVDENSWLLPTLNPTIEVADAVLGPTGRTGATVLDFYRRKRPGMPNEDAAMQFFNDGMFNVPADRLLAAAQRHNPRAYAYSFAWGTPRAPGKFGAGHGFDLPFMWDTLDMLPPGAFAQWVGREPPQELATTMHGAWVSFIKTGVPEHSKLPDWPAYDATRRATMRFDVESRVVDDPDGATRELWDEVAY